MSTGPGGFFKKWKDYARAPIQGWSPHYYCGTTGHALKFSTDQWYEMLDKANRMEKLIGDQWAALTEFDPEHKGQSSSSTSGGAWHPAGDRDQQASPVRADGMPARRPGGRPDPRHVQSPRRQGGHGECGPARQLLALPLPRRRRPVRGDSDLFMCFVMYRPHHNARAVRLNVQTPEIDFRASGRGTSGSSGSPGRPPSRERTWC